MELNEGDQSTMITSEEQLLKSPRPKIEEMKQVSELVGLRMFGI